MDKASVRSPHRAICSIATLSHLPFACALYQSLRSSGNREAFYVLVPDVGDDEIRSSDFGDATIIGLDVIKDDLPKGISVYYDAFELSNALKPYIIRYLINTLGFDSVIYCDADLYFQDSLSSVWKQLQTKPVLFTPHSLTPVPLNLNYIDETAFSNMGVLNGGLYGFRRSSESSAVLSWMCSRFVRYGFVDWQRGMFVDQKMLPLLLIYFPDSVQIFRSPLLNIAYWNVHEREVVNMNGQFVLAGEPVVFFHMSGFDPANWNNVCKYLSDEKNKKITEIAPWFLDVCEKYAALYRTCRVNASVRRYKYATYNGIYLSTRLRRRYFELGELSKYSLPVLILRIRGAVARIRRALRS